ncbi:unnamed protein product [Prorocentrum cordatum]|uniref:TauD/TfdA-like domain-containing protein n=1 Tax=Prorocentrum cordatum TaxID=2364126 RepID=A0ABN9XUS1_9DINO|nr:unnamed protein product [Polarella glacialis]
MRRHLPDLWVVGASAWRRPALRGHGTAAAAAAAPLALLPMAPAGGLALEGAGQLHELPDATASALRGRFLAAHAGVLLARGQRPASEQGLFLAKRVAGLGAFVRTSQGAVQPYAAQGRRGTPEAELPRGSDFWHQDNSYLASPARFTALYATDEVPAGEGDTLFANLVAAWDALEVHPWDLQYTLPYQFRSEKR